MSATDLLQHLRTTGFSVSVADGSGIRVAPAGALSTDQRQAIRDQKPALLALLAGAGAERPVAILARTCAGCQHLTRRQTCTEPAAAGLDPPPGHRPGADWFGIRWPPDGYGDTCASYRDEPAPAAQECLYGPSAANADT